MNTKRNIEHSTSSVRRPLTPALSPRRGEGAILLSAVLSLGVSTAWGQDVDKVGTEVILKMPGESFSGKLPALTAAESEITKALRADVELLAGKIGERNVTKYDKLVAAAAFLEKTLAGAGYKVERQTYRVRGRDCVNLAAEITGSTRPAEILIIGAHYDSVVGAPGANDNSSGVAGVLALARSFAKAKPARTLRFVFFTNEEPPWFQTEAMGSLVYAKRCREQKENIVAMLSLETIGYFSDEKDSQKYPAPFNLVYPSTGNFIGFVGDVKSGPLVSRVVTSFRKHAKFPSEGAAVPAEIVGVGWSDHWSFWQADYRALMVTDTAPFRYPHYHAKDDTPDKLDYERMARVVSGLEKVIAELATPEK
jgi:Zn-dependent M28 family amino/carboxypeptidase